MRVPEALRIVYSLAYCRYDGSTPPVDAVMDGQEALEVMRKELLEVMKTDNYKVVIKSEEGEEVRRESD
jgi:hypothetical protein